MPLVVSRRTLLTALGAVAVAPAASRAAAPPATLATSTPAEAGLYEYRLRRIWTDVTETVQQNQVPSAVLLIGRNGRIVFQEVVGTKADTLFDMASLTKVVATATAMAILIEEGKVELDAPASRYLKAFAEAGGERAQVTVRHLLTHTAGLPAGGNYRDRRVSLAEILEEIAKSRRTGAPGENFLYSDYSAITWQGIIREVTGKTLDVFCAERIFGPLGMGDTGYNPQPPRRERCAPTVPEPQYLGVVHDPTARALGGISGNAGLFSTAPDLFRFCSMWLGGGEFGGVRILKPETVRLFTDGQALTRGERALGWDRDSDYSIRGAMPPGSYGHTGFTGTSLLLDPTTGISIILLTNAVRQPDASRSVIALRRRVSTGVAEAVGGLMKPLAVPAEPVRVVTGLEALIAGGFRQLTGRKVGVVCNHTALDRQGRHIADLLHADKRANLVTLFGPEHSIRGDVDASAADSKDERTGLPVYSLYNLSLPKEQRYRPTREQLAGVDTLVFDIQDIGARYYTYIATLGYCLEAAAKFGIRMVVLDRPNPLGGELVEGPLLDPDLAGGFTTYHTMPISHGMTVGELARMYNTEKKIGAELEVISMPNWNRRLLWDDTGLPWTNPSPNMRSVRAAWLYPGVGLLEVLPLSVGRGTDTPFELFGAPFIDPVMLAEKLGTYNGASFVPTRFTPTGSAHKGKSCGGVQVNLWDRRSCLPSALGMHLIRTLMDLYPQELAGDTTNRLRGMVGAKRILDDLKAGKPATEIVASWAPDVAEWRRRRQPFLLYPA